MSSTQETAKASLALAAPPEEGSLQRGPSRALEDDMDDPVLACAWACRGMRLQYLISCTCTPQVHDNC